MDIEVNLRKGGHVKLLLLAALSGQNCKIAFFPIKHCSEKLKI